MMRLKIFITGVGGQGSLTASRLLAEAALRAGQNVVVSEVHGMAQRGGVVETAVLIGSVHSPTIGDHQAHVILGFEPVETLRAMGKASRETLVITNTRSIVPISVSLGQSRYPEVEEILAKIEGFVGNERLIALDATGLAKEAGSAIATNMVMVGALAATGRLPFPADVLKESISELAPKYAEVNLKAFELGYNAVQG